MPDGKNKKPPKQDIYGYVSPSLQRVRDIPPAQRTQAQQEFANAAELRGRQKMQREINIPVDPVGRGRPSIASRNNNPGNAISVGQLGATKDPQSRFASFNSPQVGFLALERQLRKYKERDMTLEQMVNIYAPPHENDTQEYLQRIERLTGFRGNANLRYIKTEDLAKAIALLESGTTVRNPGEVRDERP